MAKAKRGTTKFGPKGKQVVKKTMEKYKAGTLHSGRKSGPKVRSRKQAIAIGLSAARKGKAKTAAAKRKSK